MLISSISALILYLLIVLPPNSKRLLAAIRLSRTALICGPNSWSDFCFTLTLARSVVNRRSTQLHFSIQFQERPIAANPPKAAKKTLPTSMKNGSTDSPPIMTCAPPHRISMKPNQPAMLHAPIAARQKPNRISPSCRTHSGCQPCFVIPQFCTPIGGQY